MNQNRSGFSLMELAFGLLMVSAITGVALTYGGTSQRASTECYATTRAQIKDINGAIERFARTQNRLPVPAQRNLAAQDAGFGTEASTSTTQNNGVSFGAVPFSTLGLGADYAGDCWGNKYTYMVTTALTNANAMQGGTPGNIALARGTGASDVVSTTHAYAIISHGEDGLGATKINQKTTNWCTGPSLQTPNCAGTEAKVVDATFNNGKGAPNCFDDLVLVSGKPQVLLAGGGGGGLPPVGTGANCTTEPTVWNSSVYIINPSAFNAASGVCRHSGGTALSDGETRIIDADIAVNVGDEITVSCRNGHVTYTNHIGDCDID